ncbi:hypothetical protein IJL65_04235 [bacterium]|nr:hypothetical protein [bacterium]
MDDFGFFWFIENQEIVENELKKYQTEEERQQAIEEMQASAIMSLIYMFALFFLVILIVGIVKWIV